MKKSNKIDFNTELIRTRTNFDGMSSFQFVPVRCLCVFHSRTRMALIGRIFTDTKSVCIRVIRAIRVLFHLKLAANNRFFNPIYEIPFMAVSTDFAPSAVEFLSRACPRTPVTEA